LEKGIEREVSKQHRHNTGPQLNVGKIH
jgi:hypothetical protein